MGFNRWITTIIFVIAFAALTVTGRVADSNTKLADEVKNKSRQIDSLTLIINEN